MSPLRHISVVLAEFLEGLEVPAAAGGTVESLSAARIRRRVRHDDALVRGRGGRAAGALRWDGGGSVSVRPCPDCGELRGARYQHQGREVCWPCTGLDPLPATPPPPPEPSFRERILTALDEIDPRRFVYIDRDRVVHVCPVCRAGLPEYLAVRFHGEAPRADLVCSLGCPELEIADALGIR